MEPSCRGAGSFEGGQWVQQSVTQWDPHYPGLTQVERSEAGMSVEGTDLGFSTGVEGATVRWALRSEFKKGLGSRVEFLRKSGHPTAFQDDLSQQEGKKHGTDSSLRKPKP